MCYQNEQNSGKHYNFKENKKYYKYDKNFKNYTNKKIKAVAQMGVKQ